MPKLSGRDKLAFISRTLCQRPTSGFEGVEDEAIIGQAERDK